MNKRKRNIIIILSIVLVSILFIIPFGLSVLIYESNFGDRYDTYEPMARSMDEFEGLNAQKHTFSSDKGQMLVGYKYYKELEDIKGVVVIAHGLGGGGHNSYMDVADLLTSHNYMVFAYDATGNDESEGKSIKGLPQGLIDLNYALKYIKKTSDFEDLPIMLFGHSWGGYSVGNVLNLHPDVKAIVMVAGFNKSVDIIKEEGQRIAGDGINALMPYISLYERMKFGKYASYSCIGGIENSDAGAMIIYSTDDDMISQNISYDIFYDQYKDSPRFQFVKYDNRGHNYVYYSDPSRAYREQFNSTFAEYVSSLDGELTVEIKASYLNEHLDRKALYELDEELMGRIVQFYDMNLK